MSIIPLADLDRRVLRAEASDSADALVARGRRIRAQRVDLVTGGDFIPQVLEVHGGFDLPAGPEHRR